MCGSALIAGEPSEKSLDAMRKFSEQYARKSDTYFCVDKGVTAVVIKVGDLVFIVSTLFSMIVQILLNNRNFVQNCFGAVCMLVVIYMS